MKNTTLCPYCQTQLIIEQGENLHHVSHPFSLKYGYLGDDEKDFFIDPKVTLCTNPKCKKLIFSLSIGTLHNYSGLGGGIRKNIISSWDLLPESKAIAYNKKIVPAPIVDDYEEASRIIKLSPKASATLFRRCLQGMIRDFWGIKKSRLIDEIKELESLVDADIWEALETVRKCGNIGAHMEKDVNLIIDIDAKEVDQLKWLIEFLIDNWYIKRHERREKLNSLKILGAKKAVPKKSAVKKVKT